MTVGCEASTRDAPKLLIVEDDTTIAANLHQFLELRGFVVDLAHDGPAAVARISAESYDLMSSTSACPAPTVSRSSISCAGILYVLRRSSS